MIPLEVGRGRLSHSLLSPLQQSTSNGNECLVDTKDYWFRSKANFTLSTCLHWSCSYLSMGLNGFSRGAPLTSTQRPQTATRAHSDPHPDPGLCPHLSALPLPPCSLPDLISLEEKCRSIKDKGTGTTWEPKRPPNLPCSQSSLGCSRNCGSSAHPTPQSPREWELEEALDYFPRPFSVQKEKPSLRRKMACPQLAATLPNHCALFLSSLWCWIPEKLRIDEDLSHPGTHCSKCVSQTSRWGLTGKWLEKPDSPWDSPHWVRICISTACPGGLCTEKFWETFVCWGSWTLTQALGDSVI